MSRLTMKNKRGEFYIPRRYEDGYGNNVVLSNEDCINKLGHYEDLEEQGRLIELPCAVGDILYGSNEEFVIKEISYWEDDCDLYSLNIKIEDWKENFEIIDPEDIGKTVFTTKEEAEAKLAEMEGV